MSDNFDGDIKMFIGPDGADFEFNDGQPIMDSGLENNALIALFTHEGWAGNVLLLPQHQVGSDFEKTAGGTITLSKLGVIQNSAERALSDANQKVSDNQVTVGNSTGTKIDLAVRVSPVADSPALLLSSNAGLNWRNQAQNPAHKKV